MIAFLIILIVVVCLLLVLVVLVQNPKGGGLSSAFGGQGNQMLGGVKRSGDFLDKATWGLALSVFVLVLAINMTGGASGTATQDESSKIIEQSQGIDAGSIDINDGLQSEVPAEAEGQEELPPAVD